MTLEEWGELDEDESGELVDGCLEEDELGSFLHDFVVAWFIATFSAWLNDRGLVAASEVKYAVAEVRGRKLDISVFFRGRKPPARGLVRIPPDIAVEVISDAPRDRRCDRIDKLGEYERFGIRYYWLVDPAARTLEIFELGQDGRYVRALGASEGRLEQVPGCEGLVLDLDALWKRADSIESQTEEEDSGEP